jgi:uncharacterized membrane protein YqiK
LNKLSAEQVMLTVRLEMIRQLPNILEKAVKPMEKIESIRLFQVNGMPGGAANDGSASGGQGGATLPEQVVNSALNYQIAKPVVDAIMKDAGLGSGSLTSIAQALSTIAVPQAAVTVGAAPDGNLPAALETTVTA